MRPEITLTKREEELMDFLWDNGEAMTSNDILERCTDRSWSDSYLQVMIRSLLGKGMLEQVGMVRYGTQYARKFSCTMCKEEYLVALAAERDLDKGQFAKAAVAMAVRESGEGRQALINELKKQLKELAAEV